MKKNSKNFEERANKLVAVIDYLFDTIKEVDKTFNITSFETNDSVDPHTDKTARSFYFDGSYRILASIFNDYFECVVIPICEEYNTKEELTELKEKFPELDIYEEDDDIIALLTTPEKVIDFYEKKYHRLIKYADFLRQVFVDEEE